MVQKSENGLTKWELKRRKKKEVVVRSRPHGQVQGTIKEGTGSLDS
jgi:hypothetical protein